MVLILLEALTALLVLLLIVWWTMFAGRKNGELPQPAQDPTDPHDGASSGKPDDAGGRADTPSAR